MSFGLPLGIVDIPVYALTALLLVVISAAGMYLPALRAMRVDPIPALRME